MAIKVAKMGDKLSLQKLAFSRVLSRDLGLWVSADFYHRENIENLAAYISFGAVLNKDELNRFWGQVKKLNVTARANIVIKSFVRQRPDGSVHRRRPSTHAVSQKLCHYTFVH